MSANKRIKENADRIVEIKYKTKYEEVWRINLELRVELLELKNQSVWQFIKFKMGW